jgi:hypothetical protein
MPDQKSLEEILPKEFYQPKDSRQPKEAHELVVKENFTIESALEKNIPVYTSPPPQTWVFGSSIPRHLTGYRQTTILKVKPDSNIPVIELRFKGGTDLKKGDYISAKIPLVEEHTSIAEQGHPFSQKTIYFSRDYKTIEDAIELSLLDKDGNILNIKQSADYDNYIKK